MTFHLCLSSESYALLFLCIDDCNLLVTVLGGVAPTDSRKKRGFTLLSTLLINKAYEKEVKPILYKYVCMVSEE